MNDRSSSAISGRWARNASRSTASPRSTRSRYSWRAACSWSSAGPGPTDGAFGWSGSVGPELSTGGVIADRYFLVSSITRTLSINGPAKGSRLSRVYNSNVVLFATAVNSNVLVVQLRLFHDFVLVSAVNTILLAAA